MIGEDAVNSTTALLEKLMQIVLEIIKMQRERQYRNPQNYAKETKQPKIKFGEMKKSEYTKMLNAGDKMHRIEVDKKQLDGLNSIAKQIGAKYWVMSNEGNNASVIVPEKYFDQMKGALEEATKLQLTQNPQSLAVHNGDELINEADISLVRDVLEYHDIPAVSFKTDNGYMNIVASEYDGQYKAALQEVAKLKDELKNIDITSFDQTLPFEYISKLDETVITVNEEQAQYIKSNVPEAELLKDENGTIAVKYPNSAENRVQSCSESFSKDIEMVQDYLITIVDSSITINKDKLLISENASEYFTKVPNTAGKDYIKISKEDAALLDGGKTITTKLDYEKKYQIFNEDGSLKTEQTGKELAAKYNTKSRNADKNTSISHYNNDSLDRIELYNAKSNKLISIGIENADIIRSNLLKQGFSKFAAEKLLADINKVLPQNFKDVFQYSAHNENAKFNEISSDVLTQYMLAKKIESAELVDGYNDTLGSKCCIYDKNTDKCILVPAQENRLKEALSKMGYDRLQVNVIASETQKSYTAGGAVLERESIEAKSFETDNAEVGAFKFNADGQGFVLIKQEITDNNEISIKYADISQETTRPEIEKALRNEFQMKDSASVAEILNCMEKEQLISKAVSDITKTGFEISRVSSDYIKISKGDDTLMTEQNKVDVSKICSTFGITEKEAEKLRDSLDRSVKAAEKKEKGQTFNELKRAAKTAYENIKAEKKVKEAEKTVTAELDRR